MVKYEMQLMQWNKQSYQQELRLKNPHLGEVHSVNLMWCAFTITEPLRCTSICFQILGKQKT